MPFSLVAAVDTDWTEPASHPASQARTQTERKRERTLPELPPVEREGERVDFMTSSHTRKTPYMVIAHERGIPSLSIQVL